jgi:L-ribulose-5-phosphate 3-epimerase
MKNLLPYTRLLLMFTTMLLSAFVLYQCQPATENAAAGSSTSEAKGLKISLAQWSLHQAFQKGSLQAENFAAIAKNDFGINAIEYVNGFYKAHASDKSFWQMMRAKADSLGVISLLIMVDEEGDLGNPDAVARKQAVENHYKWVDAASILGCHSIRVNAFGTGTREQVQDAMVDALKQLGAYAAKSNINVLIENHGLYSSDGKWVAEIMQKVAMPNVGTLPDFGNWCTSHQWGSIQKGKECHQAYDLYQGVSDLLPFAKGVSAKSYGFDEKGEETTIDYGKMMQLVKQSDFSGYVGIEYEGTELSEAEGILATKRLLERVMNF